MRDDCPDDDCLARFLERQLAPARRAEVEAHLDRCADCRGIVAAGFGTGSGSVTSPPLTIEMPPDALVPAEAGHVLADKIELLRVIGSGGMGRVFEAHHRRLDQRVAVKVMHADLAGSRVAVRRFLREARAAARLVSPHAARILDVDETPSGVPYIVMELLDGEDVQAVLARRALTVAETVTIALEAGAAIAEAHGLGLVHRDLKPHNIVLARVGRAVVAKVVDFGLAKELAPPDDAAPSSRTTGDLIVGTPLFMAPEQIRTPRAVDARVDVWGLGATLYAMLARRSPFDAPTLEGVVEGILHASPPALRVKRPDVPPALEAIVVRALAKDRVARFSSIFVMLEALRALDVKEVTLQLVTQPLEAPAPTERDPRTARFQLGEQIGTGGMGVVYRAYDTLLERAVAVKLVRPDRRGDEAAARRSVVREARAAAALTHPNTVTIFDVVEDDDAIFIAMELLEGETLRAVMERPPAPLATRLRWLREAALALAAAHQRGLVHRDVKPDNLFIGRDGTLKVLDFGIAKRDAEPEGQIVGTPRYMAPEQRAGHRVDARADQYAWGLVAFELLTGRRAPAALAERRAQLRAAEPGLSPAVLHAVGLASQPDPASRLSSMDEVAECMADATSTRTTVPTPRRSRAWIALFAVAAVAAGAAGLVVATRGTIPVPGKPAAPACVVAPGIRFPLLPGEQLGFDGQGAPTFSRGEKRSFRLEQRVSPGAPLTPVDLPRLITAGLEDSHHPVIGGGMFRGRPTVTVSFETGADHGAMLFGANDQREFTNRIYGPITGMVVTPFNDTTLVLVTTEANGVRPANNMNRVEARRVSDDAVIGIENGGAHSPVVAVGGHRAGIAYVTPAGIRFAVLDQNLELAVAPVTVAATQAAPALAYDGTRASVYWVAGGRLMVATARGDLPQFSAARVASEDVVTSEAPFASALADGAGAVVWTARVATADTVRWARVADVLAPLDLAHGGPFRDLALSGGRVMWRTNDSAAELVEVTCR